MGRRKASSIEGPIVAHRLELMESDSMASLNMAARRVLDRLEFEHMHHGGKENGNLPCTYEDFARFGVRRQSIPRAIKALVRAGLVVITHKGRGGNAEWRQASPYHFTYIAAKGDPPTDEWKRYVCPKI